MAKKAMNFSSKAAYGKWLAYGHMHGDFAASPGNTPVKIKGKAKKVKHGKKPHPKRAQSDSERGFHSKMMKSFM